MIYVINNLGDVIYNSNSVSKELPLFTNLSEESIGTNAAGISLISGMSLTVNGCEHYNKILTNYISTSIVIESSAPEKNIIVVFFTPCRLRSSHERLHDILTDHFSKDEKESDDQTPSMEVHSDEDSHMMDHENDNKDVKVSTATSELMHDMDLSVDESSAIIESLLNDETSESSVENKGSVNTLKSSVETSISSHGENNEKYSILKACKEFTLSIVEAQTIREALTYHNWNLKKTSEALGIGRSTLYRKLKEYKIEK
ncbi:helix-turn-helix domain-containing protein [Acidaminobacter sp. JC074]|uniref:helix-turn-helix domain-containing protein n=1 Tax=Acidaminobacter sp. JC074 TaxID=2530199 RepID=UPI001F0F0602|nr:helix-turn-helix domain-containing protein [Acidaminobacter sp. JC074]